MIYKINRLFKLCGIKERFFFWTFAFLFLISCFYVFIVIVLDKNNRLNEIEENLVFSIKNQQSIIENWAKERAEEIRLFANFPVSKDVDIAVMAKRFKYYHNYHQHLDSIVFIDQDGYVKIDTAHDQVILEESTINLRDRKYFKAAIAGKEYMHDLIISKATGNPVFVFSAPIFNDENQFQGLVFGAVHLAKVNDMLRETIQGDQAQVMLINEEGRMISRLLRNNNQSNERIPEIPISTKLLDIIEQSEDTFLTYKDENDEENFIAYTTLFDDRYYLVHQVSKREILAPHYQIITSMIAFAIIIIIIGILMITRISERLLQSFMQLVQALNQVKSGKYQTQIAEQDYERSPVELQQLVQGFNEMSASIEEKKRTLKRLSTTDDLTKIPNRRKFDQYLNLKWEIAQENRTPISLIFIDVDHFKQYNDLFGHQQGDECLKNLAQALQSFAIRNNYFAARYGGEEFVIVLFNTSLEKAEKVAEKVRRQVEDLQIRRNTRDIITDNIAEQYITVSIGVARIVPDRSTVKETLIQLADQALYEAKSNGRNRVVVHRTHKLL